MNIDVNCANAGLSTASGNLPSTRAANAACQWISDYLGVSVPIRKSRTSDQGRREPSRTSCVPASRRLTSLVIHLKPLWPLSSNKPLDH